MPTISQSDVSYPSWVQNFETAVKHAEKLASEGKKVVHIKMNFDELSEYILPELRQTLSV